MLLGQRKHDENSEDGDKLKIKPVKGNKKDKIPNPDLAKENVIPRINTSNIFVGSTGMGKSTLTTNLLTKDQFYGGKQADGKPWFDTILLVSPTGDTDDVQKELKLPDEAIFTDLDAFPHHRRISVSKLLS